MNRATLIAILGLIALLGIAQSVERHVAAEEVAPVDSGVALSTSSASGTVLIATTGPVGSCSRCGRNVYSAWTDKNATLDVRDPHSSVVLWHGCTECLYEILRRNP